MIAAHRKLIQRCLEDGISYGMRRAYKHSEVPTQQQIEIEVYQAVMNEIDEWFEFGDNYVNE